MTLPSGCGEYAPMLAQSLLADEQERGPLEFSVKGTRIRHSWAAKCSRAIGYSLHGVEPEPLTEQQAYTFGIGHILHDAFQKALKERFGENCEIEAACQTNGSLSSGHIDAILRKADGSVDCIEIKTINGLGYRTAIGIGKGAGGPRHSAVVQGAVNAYTYGADRLIIIYLPLEAVSLSTAAKHGLPDELRYCAEWIYERDEFERLAQEEIARWQWIVDTVDSGMLPPRYIPDPSFGGKAVIIQPDRGSYQREDGYVGRTWQCDYCEFRDKCIADG